MGKKELSTEEKFFGAGLVEALGVLLPLKGISLDPIENIKPALDILHNTTSNSTFNTPDLNLLLAIISLIIGLVSIITLYTALRSGNRSLNALYFILGLLIGVFVFVLIP